MKKPVVAITIGDPAGIGPEIVLKSLKDRGIYARCRPLVIGDAQQLSLRSYGVKLRIRPILNPSQARFRPGTAEVLHVPYRDFVRLPQGRPSAASGACSARFVELSVQLALTGLASAVVHAPISKLAWKLAGVDYPGHTEMIAQLCGVRKFAMAIASEPLRTVMVTRHVPLERVSSHLRKDEIINAIRLAGEWMRKRGIQRPRIGVCALNPHAGEKGLIGSEEIRIIAPALRLFHKEDRGRTRVSGPLPADSAFRDHRKGLYDCLVTLYHDQSLIPLKLFGSDRLVNISLGFPFPRTSPGHGTAFDIAGKGKANPAPMKEAILTAARLCRPA